MRHHDAQAKQEGADMHLLSCQTDGGQLVDDQFVVLHNRCLFAHVHIGTPLQDLVTQQ